MDSLFAQLHDGNIKGAFIDQFVWRYYFTVQTDLNQSDIGRIQGNIFDKHLAYHGLIGKNISDELYFCMGEASIDDEMVVLKKNSAGWSALEVGSYCQVNWKVKYLDTNFRHFMYRLLRAVRYMSTSVPVLSYM